MKFGLVHRLLTDALAVLGLLSLISSGDLDRSMSVVIVLGLVLALAIPERLQDHRLLRRGGAAASIVLLLVQSTRLVLGGDILAVAVEFAAALQVIRLATRRGAVHDHQIILLALLHLVAGTVLGGGLSYGLCFVGFLVVAPGALVLSHLRREVEGNYRQGARDRTGLPVDVPRILRSRRVISRKFLLLTCSLSIPIFLFTAILFIAFPRVGLSLLLLSHSRSTRMIGFSDRVDLGGVGKLRADPTIAMRVHFDDLPAEPPPRLSLYLRGTAFDEYDGRAWSRTQSGQSPAHQIGTRVTLHPGPVLGPTRKIAIDLEPIVPAVLFLPPRALSLDVRDRGESLLGRSVPIHFGPEDELKYSSDDRGLRYEVIVSTSAVPPIAGLSGPDRSRYLAVPPSVTPPIRDLARKWTAGEDTPLGIASALERVLRSEYPYDLDSPSGAAENPLEDFLLQSRRGHCEFYSTALAMMLRTLGVPSRNVTGFVGGTYNRFGRFYAVRQGDAHSWVEAYIDGVGWQRFDPTPPAGAEPQARTDGLMAFVRDVLEAAAQRWDRHVIGYDLDQQLRLLRSLSERYTPGGAQDGILQKLSFRRLLLLSFGLGLLIWSIQYLRRHRSHRPRDGDPRSLDPGQLAIVALYHELEATLAAKGVPRPTSTPPLAHARSIALLGHPLGEEALALTEIYLNARFGGHALDEDARKDYMRRVRELRQIEVSIGTSAEAA
jgi:protein-glutamine gamma-glutamyltransferase